MYISKILFYCPNCGRYLCHDEIDFVPHIKEHNNVLLMAKAICKKHKTTCYFRPHQQEPSVICKMKINDQKSISLLTSLAKEYAETITKEYEVKIEKLFPHAQQKELNSIYVISFFPFIADTIALKHFNHEDIEYAEIPAEKRCYI